MVRVRSRAVALACLALLVLTGCAGHYAYRPILNPDEWSSRLYPGDHVRVTTDDGEEFGLVVAEVTEEQLVGEKRAVALQDIRLIEKRESKQDWSADTGWAMLGSLWLVAALGAWGLSALLD